MRHIDQDKCMDCGVALTIKNRHPVYSSRLMVIGYTCEVCRDKRKSPEARKREEEISKLTKDIPKLENVRQNIRKALDNN